MDGCGSEGQARSPAFVGRGQYLGTESVPRQRVWLRLGDNGTTHRTQRRTVACGNRPIGYAGGPSINRNCTTRCASGSDQSSKPAVVPARKSDHRSDHFIEHRESWWPGRPFHRCLQRSNWILLYFHLAASCRHSRVGCRSGTDSGQSCFIAIRQCVSERNQPTGRDIRSSWLGRNVIEGGGRTRLPADRPILEVRDME